MKLLQRLMALGPWGWAAVSVAALVVVIWVATILVIEPRHAAVVRAEARVQKATAEQSSDTTKTVLSLVQKSSDKTQKTHERQTKNATAIEQLSSSNTSIPDLDARAFIRGLCMYDASGSDSACVGLQKAGS